MSFFTSKRTPKEQIESGRLTFLLALKLSRLAYQVSKRKLQQFYIPTLVLLAVVPVSYTHLTLPTIYSV